MRILAHLLIVFVTVTSCKSAWTEEEIVAFKANCVSASQMQNEANPEAYCTCMTAKMQAKFPNPNDMEEILLEQDSLQAMAAQCRSASSPTTMVWTEESSAAFIRECTAFAAEQNITNPSYCPCVLAKVQLAYPTKDKLTTLSKETMAAIGDGCK